MIMDLELPCRLLNAKSNHKSRIDNPSFGNLQSTLCNDGGHRLLAFTWALDPPYVRLLAEPDQLPARVAAVLADDERARRRFVAHAVQVLEGLAVDEARERQRGFRDAAGEQTADLVEQPARELRLDAPRHALGGVGGGHAQRECRHLVF